MIAAIRREIYNQRRGSMMIINYLNVPNTTLPRLGSRVQIPSPAPVNLKENEGLCGGRSRLVREFRLNWPHEHSSDPKSAVADWRPRFNWLERLPDGFDCGQARICRRIVANGNCPRQIRRLLKEIGNFHFGLQYIAEFWGLGRPLGAQYAAAQDARSLLES
jgi:hypothetical protein